MQNPVATGVPKKMMSSPFIDRKKLVQLKWGSPLTILLYQIRDGVLKKKMIKVRILYGGIDD